MMDTMDEFTCDICSATEHVSRMVERTVVGKQRVLCSDCNEYLQDYT